MCKSLLGGIIGSVKEFVLLGANLILERFVHGCTSKVTTVIVTS